MTPFRLLTMRRFAPFFVAQFLGVFNDNLYRNALVVLFSLLAAGWTMSPPDSAEELAAGIFVLPVFLFSGVAGQLADKYDKATLARFVKALEMAAMGVAAAGFLLHSLAVLLGALFLLGTASALFGPIRYAFMPQHLSGTELVGGNALVAPGLFVSILTGAATGGMLAASGVHPAWIAAAGFLVAALGLVASCRIPAAPGPAPDLPLCLNPLAGAWRNIGFSRENPLVFMAIVGIAWFWLHGALLLSQAPAFARNVLGGGEGGVTLLLAIFTGGIGLGSILCEKLSGRHVEIGLAPFGAFGMAIFGLDLSWALSGAALPVSTLIGVAGTWRVLFDLLAIGIFSGFFIVPLHVLMQSKSEPERRARIVAASNILNAAFIVVGSLVAAALLALGASIPQLLGIAALCNGLAALFVSRRVPEHLIRFVASIVIHSIYRLEKRGLEQIPDDGPAVLIFNHVSFVDPVIIMAAVRRPIRFVIDHAIYRLPIANSVFRCARTIPIAPAKEDPGIKEEAFVKVAEALRNGDLIGLFPEGRITRDGELNSFRYGVQRITSETPVPVIPMALRGLWGSFFSRRYGPAMRVPSCIRPFRKIELVADAPVPPEKADPAYLQGLVESLRGDLR